MLCWHRQVISEIKSSGKVLECQVIVKIMDLPLVTMRLHADDIEQDQSLHPRTATLCGKI